jgi:hypothetical protein
MQRKRPVVEEMKEPMSKMVGDLQVLQEDRGVLICKETTGGGVRLRRLAVIPEKKAMDRALRRASWLQHSGWCSLREFYLDGQQLYLRGPLPSDQRIEAYLAERPQPLEALVAWLLQLVEMLMEIHNQRTPLYLGCLTSQDLRVTDKGALQLLGLDIGDDCKLRFFPSGDRPAPDSLVDGRSDVWCLGKIFQDWVNASSAEVRRAYDESRALRELVASMVSSQAERRPSNLNILKSRLEQLKYKAPQEHRGLLSKLPASWELAREEYQKFLVGALATFVTGILVTGLLFPG